MAMANNARIAALEAKLRQKNETILIYVNKHREVVKEMEDEADKRDIRL
jgi:hypothetical protein